MARVGWSRVGGLNTYSLAKLMSMTFQKPDEDEEVLISFFTSFKIMESSRHELSQCKVSACLCQSAAIFKKYKSDFTYSQLEQSKIPVYYFVNVAIIIIGRNFPILR